MKTTLIEHLKDTIVDENHCISFASFMELALYHPQFGYYNADHFHLGGENGAFMTAAEISPLYAQCFAKQCLQLFHHYTEPYILELGAGSGRFAYELLSALEKDQACPTHYYIYDVSLQLRKKQQNFLQQMCPQWLSRITWLETLPDQFSGIIIANEVLDALPVHCFKVNETEIKEKCISINQHQQLSWKLVDSKHPELIHEVNEIYHRYHLPNHYESEINLQLQKFIASLAQLLKQGTILFADYGYGQQEYYHPERITGTLATIYQGRHLNDPLQYPGQQDITAHVDFTRVADYAIQNSLSLAGYTTQAAFLLSLGLMDFAEALTKNQSDADVFRMQQAIKYLTLPSEMGERIKIMALNKNVVMESGERLLGFNFKDNRREL